jgi:hypothetical protein
MLFPQEIIQLDPDICSNNAPVDLFVASWSRCWWNFAPSLATVQLDFSPSVDADGTYLQFQMAVIQIPIDIIITVTQAQMQDRIIQNSLRFDGTIDLFTVLGGTPVQMEHSLLPNKPGTSIFDPEVRCRRRYIYLHCTSASSL